MFQGYSRQEYKELKQWFSYENYTNGVFLCFNCRIQTIRFIIFEITVKW